MRALHACLIAVVVISCSRTPPSLDRIAEGYVQAALRLAQHDPALVDAWRGPDRLMPGPRGPVAGIQADIRALRGAIDELADHPRSAQQKARIEYLDAQLRALDFAAARLLGRSAGIDEQARDEFAVAFSQPDENTVASTLADIGRLLPGGGPLIDRVNALRQRTAVPAGRAEAVMAIALDACHDAVAPIVELPKDEEVAVRFHGNMPWDAFARYAGGHRTIIEINDAGPIDVSRALRLACHEGYAGHHVQHLLIDQMFGERHWPELELTPGFGRHLLWAEGAAEVGADLAFTPAARASLYRDRLFPAAGLDPKDIDALVALDDLLPSLLPVVTEVARRYLDGRLTEDQAIERLANQALLGNPQATLAFIERRRARALVYGEGRRVIYSMMPARSLAGLRDLFRHAAAIQ